MTTGSLLLTLVQTPFEDKKASKKNEKSPEKRTKQRYKILVRSVSGSQT
jgi:hypothetical protein